MRNLHSKFNSEGSLLENSDVFVRKGKTTHVWEERRDGLRFFDENKAQRSGTRQQEQVLRCGELAEFIPWPRASCCPVQPSPAQPVPAQARCDMGDRVLRAQ